MSLSFLLAPGQPLLPSEKQFTAQSLFAEGTVEAQIEASLRGRGWSWHLVKLTAEGALALLERRNETENEAVLTPVEPFL